MKKIGAKTLLRLGCCGLLFCMFDTKSMNQVSEQEYYAFIKEQCEAIGSSLQQSEMELLAAIQCNNVEHVKVLMADRARNRINLNAQDPTYNRSALHFAVSNNNLEIVRLILGVPEVNINLQDKFGETPLHLAVTYGTSEIINELLNEMSIDLNVEDKSGRTPLYNAIVNHKYENLKSLLGRSGININKMDSQGDSVLHIASAFDDDALKYVLNLCRLDINAKNLENDTPLHVAAENLSASRIAILLENGARYTLRGKGELIPILAAINTVLESDPYLHAVEGDLVLNKLLAVLKTFVSYGVIPPKEEVIAFLDKNEEALERIENYREDIIQHKVSFKLNQTDLQYSLKDLILKTLYSR